MSAEVLANADETRSNLREAVAMDAYTLEQVGALVTKSVVIAGGAFHKGDLHEAYAELSFAADLIVYMIGKERDKDNVH